MRHVVRQEDQKASGVPPASSIWVTEKERSTDEAKPEGRGVVGVVGR